MQVYSPKRHRRAPKIAEDNSVYSTVNSTKTPSIIELENLRYEPSQEYIVDTMPTPNSLTYRPLPAVQMKKTYQPHTTPRWEGRKKTTVYVTVTFLKLGEIDTIKEYFEADVYIQAKWREPLLDNTKVGRPKHLALNL
jgi:hypothetical protein